MGFTLIELLIALAIVATMTAALVVTVGQDARTRHVVHNLQHQRRHAAPGRLAARHQVGGCKGSCLALRQPGPLETWPKVHSSRRRALVRSLKRRGARGGADERAHAQE